jgi:acyl-coenzyme A thioesterase PaaI-like protein
VEEADVLAGRATVTLRLKVNEAELQVLQTLLHGGLILVQLHVCLTLSDNVLLQFLCQCISASHLAHCSSGDIFLLSETRFKLQEFAIVGRSIAHGW